MSILEVRRHSTRKTGAGSQLSQEGVNLAREVGAKIGPFTKVIASVSPRSRETAIAMGFAVDHEIVSLSMDGEVFRSASEYPWWAEVHPFVGLAKALTADNAYTRYAQSMAGLWRDLMTPMADEDSVLVIGHSGEIEAPLVSCFPHADYASWGQTFGPCEGARITFEGEPAYFTGIEIVRVPNPPEEVLETSEQRLLGL